MLTRLRMKNFKRFEEVDIPLGNTVVFIGPNNSGKTTALQAFALWDIGIKAWNSKRQGKTSPEKRPGVTINRRDLINIPVPSSSLLWKGLHVRRKKSRGEGTENIRIDVIVSGVTKGKAWDCGLEFDFSNEESFICRPLRLPDYKNVPVNQAKFSTIPSEATAVKVGYLPPMSGLSAEEALLQPGRINVLLGQGQTAQVLRNLCYQIYENKESEQAWVEMTRWIHSLFGVKLLSPKFVVDRGEITMEYEERGTRLDLSSSGRGIQQTLLLLTHLYANPNTILLLDEPDAHLEILRQRETFRVITEVAEKQGSQVIAASHSEVVLSEAATRGNVVAFIGKPHLINDRKSQLLKSLTEIGWDQYYQAEQTGWVLYLESASDLEILRSFAEILEHKRAVQALSRPFIHYVSSNLPQRCRDHFYGLKEAKPNLIGIALFDRLDKELKTDTPLYEMMWNRREIENYFCTKEVLLSYAHSGLNDDLFGRAESDSRERIMRESIQEVVRALETLDKPDSMPWSADIKASDDLLNPVFKKYFSKLGLPLLLRKTDYHLLAKLISREKIDLEVIEKLELIANIAEKAEKKE